MSNTFRNKILLAALITGCYFFSGCENDPQEVAAGGGSKSLFDEAQQVQAMISQNGRTRAQLSAPYMLRYSVDTSFTEFPRSLHVNFYDSSGKVESQLDARYGKYFESRNQVYLRDSVVVFSVKGDTLRTPDLWWDQNTGKFYTDKEIRLKTRDLVIYRGKGFEAEQDLSRFVIFQPYGLIAVPDSMQVQ